MNEHTKNKEWTELFNQSLVLAVINNKELTQIFVVVNFGKGFFK